MSDTYSVREGVVANWSEGVGANWSTLDTVRILQDALRATEASLAKAEAKLAEARKTHAEEIALMREQMVDLRRRAKKYDQIVWLLDPVTRPIDEYTE